MASVPGASPTELSINVPPQSEPSSPRRNGVPPLDAAARAMPEINSAPNRLHMPGGEALVGLAGAVLTQDEEQRFSEADRALMLVHFSAANELTARLQSECGGLASANSALTGQLAEEQRGRLDEFEYLTGQITNKNTQIAALLEEVADLKEERDAVDEGHKKARAATARATQIEHDAMSAELSEIRAALKKVEVFISKESEYDAQLASLKEAIETGAKERRHEVAGLDRAHIEMKESLKKEMVIKLRVRARAHCPRPCPIPSVSIAHGPSLSVATACRLRMLGATRGSLHASQYPDRCMHLNTQIAACISIARSLHASQYLALAYAYDVEPITYVLVRAPLPPPS